MSGTVNALVDTPNISARLFVKNKGYHAYWGYTSSDDSPITQFFTTDSFEIEDKDFYLNGRACVW